MALIVDVEYKTRIYSEQNMRQHWGTVAARKKSQRTLAWAELRLAARDKPPMLAPLTITLTRRGPRKLDGDNLQGGLKATRDGVADWLGVDDGSDLLRWEYEQANGDYSVGIKIEDSK